MVRVDPTSSPTEDAEAARKLRHEFETLADQWMADTRHLSVVNAKIVHPAYLQMIAMGQTVLPLILKSLEERPAHWFAALRAIARTDPAPEGASPARARQAWLEWGRQQGILRDSA